MLIGSFPHASRVTRHASRLLAALTLTAIPTLAPAQEPARQAEVRDDANFDFYSRGPYRPTVPRPDSLLGYAIGDLNTQYAWQERVLGAIASAASDRVVVEPFATTQEGRTMRLYVVSAPENIQRLDAIRADLAAIADPRGRSPADLDAIVARTPAVTMLSFSVHGNESPGFEAAMTVLYQLAASTEAATVEALRRSIVVINPSSNPDGHERFTVWYNSVHVGDPNPSSFEHQEPWSIQGRFNHYRFDMNRDVIASTQREVQGIMNAMLRWTPMVAVDLHGMTTQYFFPPAALPVNPNISEQSRRWLDVIGRGNAAAFDRYGWMYYVRDYFDLYYPGYWDTWPSLFGATGMTYETDGGGWKGILWRRDDGSLLSFRDGISKHHVAALATVETTAARAEERVRDFLRFRQQSVEQGRTQAMKRVVFLPGRDPQRAAELAAALLRSGIEVRRATDAFSASRAHGYAGGAVRGPGGRRFDAGAYVVDLAQPLGRLAKSILEPDTPADSAFARRQIERFTRNRMRGEAGYTEPYEFYDITAWSLPVAFGVETYWTEDAGAVTGEPLSVPREGAVAGIPMLRKEHGAAHTPLPVAIDGGIVEGANARSAYLFSPERTNAAPLAARLLGEGYRVAVSPQPLEAGGRQWPRGTYVVRVGRNDGTLHARLDSLAREYGVDVRGTNTAYAETAQYGVGSEVTGSLVAPKIAVAVGDGLDQTAYGAVWWSLERRFGLPFTPLRLSTAPGALDDYNVLVVPDGSPGAIAALLGESGTAAIRRWVQGGGTLVLMGGAAAWAAREGVNLTSARAVGSGDSASQAASPGDSAAAARRPGQQAVTAADTALLGVRSPGASDAAPVGLPGAHFEARLDRTHWLTHGLDDRESITALVGGGTFLQLSRQGTNVAVFPATGPLLRAGFVWPDTERQLRNTALVVDEPLGGGHVVLFNHNPLFRGWWRAWDKVVLNAIVLGPAF